MAEKAGPEPADRVVIGITFGNSNSSIAYTSDDKAEVIANEDGGEYTLCEAALCQIRKGCADQEA